MLDARLSRVCMASGKSKRFGVVAEEPEQQSSPRKRYQSHRVPAMVAHIDPISRNRHEGSSQQPRNFDAIASMPNIFPTITRLPLLGKILSYGRFLFSNPRSADGHPRLHFIRASQATGYPLDDIAVLLRMRDGTRGLREDVQVLIEERLSDIERQVDDLWDVQRALKAFSQDGTAPSVREVAQTISTHLSPLSHRYNESHKKTFTPFLTPYLGTELII